MLNNMYFIMIICFTKYKDIDEPKLNQTTLSM